MKKWEINLKKPLTYQHNENERTQLNQITLEKELTLHTKNEESKGLIEQEETITDQGRNIAFKDES